LSDDRQGWGGCRGLIAFEKMKCSRDFSSNMSLEYIEKAVAQILVAYRVIEDDDLQRILRDLISELPEEDNQIPHVAVIFSRINRRLRIQKFEIKTVVIRNGSDIHKYHCLTNISEDLVALKYGSSFTPIEVDFFRKIASFILLDSSAIGMTEIEKNFKPKGYDQRATESLMQKLVTEKWLQLNEKNYWELAPRSYAELRSAFEMEISESEKEDIADKMSQLPQIVLY